MEWILTNAEQLGGLATVLMMFIGLWALWFARTQIFAQREATAKDIYRDYLKLAFDHPRTKKIWSYEQRRLGGMDTR